MPSKQQMVEANFAKYSASKDTLKTNEQKFLDNHVRCVCHNVIHVNHAYCPFCNRFNMATNQSQCPTCGQQLPKEAPAQP